MKFLFVLAGCMTVATALHADPYEWESRKPRRYSGVVCEKLDQMKAYIREESYGLDPSSSLDAVNDGVEGGACWRWEILYQHAGESVRHAGKGMTYAIRKVMVEALRDEASDWIPQNPAQPYYIYFAAAEPPGEDI